MPAAALLRIEIERKLAHRIPGALTPLPQSLRATTPFGVSDLETITGGLSVGAITELTGSAGSGRTSLSLAAVAQATRSAHVAAWVDTSNAFDPVSAAASGVLLHRLLWVRCCPSAKESTQIVLPAQPQSGFPAPHTDRVQHSGGSPHPRSEERGLPQAINALLATPPTDGRVHIRTPGTPGTPNRPLAQSSTPRHRLSLRIEQAGTDRQPSRRGSYVLQQRELFGAPTQQPVQALHASTARPGRAQHSKPWPRIEQAFRVTDLLLQAGGFQVIVLDLADIAAEHVTRVPLATWFRFRAAAEHAQTALLVLTQHPCTGSSRAMLLKAEGAGEIEDATCFPGLRFTAAVARQRFAPAPENSIVVPLRKPPRSVPTANWSAPAHWAIPRMDLQP